MSGVALNYPYLDRVDHWRRGRALWLAGAFLSVGLELFSVLYFQKGLGLKPCLYCVYIREAIILIALGSLWAAICPSLGFFRILGHLVSLAGSFLVLFFSFKLETLNVIAKYWPDEYVSCGARAGFSLGRWLAAKWPTHFLAQGDCGHDKWMFLSFNMSQLLIIAFVLVFCALLVALLAGFAKSSPANSSANPKARRL